MSKYYTDVPAEQREALHAFRQNYPLKTLSSDPEWRYITAGKGERTILWLVGGLARADAAYQTIPMLVDDFRIIAPDYPSPGNIDALADGLAAILEAEGVEQAYVLAGSFGGMLAQVFLRRHTERVAKLVLSTTTPPNIAQIDNYKGQLELVQVADEATVRDGAKLTMFQTIAPAEKDAAFYRAYLDELYSERLGKDDLVALYQAIIDFLGREFTPEDLEHFEGEILIIDSADDATFGSVREAMYALYPDAQVHTFTGAGHSPGSTQREAFFAKVREFFSS